MLNEGLIEKAPGTVKELEKTLVEHALKLEHVTIIIADIRSVGADNQVSLSEIQKVKNFIAHINSMSEQPCADVQNVVQDLTAERK